MKTKRSASGLFLAVVFVTGCAASFAKSGDNIGTFAREYTRNAIVKGTTKEALTQLETWASQAKKNKDWDGASNFYTEASRAARLSGQFQKAVSHAHRALETGENAKDSDLQARAILHLVSALGLLKRYTEQRDWLRKGFEVARLIPAGGYRESIEATLYHQLGEEFLRTGQLTEAIENLFYAVQARESLVAVLRRYRAVWGQHLPGNENALVGELASLGRAYQRKGMLAEAIATYEKGLTTISRSGLQTYYDLSLRARLGRVYLGQKDYISAEANLRKAVEGAETRQLTQIVQAAGHSMGDLLLQTGKPFEAISFYRKAIDSIESTRSLLTSEGLRSTFFADQQRTYRDMVRAQLRDKNLEQAFNYNERSRSRAFLDILGSKVQLARGGALLEEERDLQAKMSTLQAMMVGQDPGTPDRPQLRQELNVAQKAYNDFLARVRQDNKEQASLMNVEPLTLKQVQELLGPGVTILEYFVTDSTVWLWVVEKDRLQFVSTASARKDLVAKVTELRDAIYQFGEKERFNALSQELHKLLLQPALPHIRGKELIIVPHDVLHYLPFQALVGSDGQYLIEKYPIYYLSSASLLQFIQEKRQAMGEHALAFGNPDLGDPEKNLDYAELEAQEIKTAYPQAVVYLKREATEGKAKALSPTNDIIHFATHAELKEDDPLTSAILLAKTDKEDGRLEVKEIFGMNLKASLVVLSGCDTGLGKLSTGDELVGLTRAFIYAGTPSVLASLWKIDDSSTAMLMANFYKNLKTMTKAEALRQAQLQLIRGNISSNLLARRGVGGVGKLGETPKPQAASADTDLLARSASDSLALSTSHPYFWAPFILVGDGK